MLSRFALLLLCATSLAPVGLLWSLKLWDTDREYAWSLIVISVLMVVLARLFLYAIPRLMESRPLGIAKTKSVDKDVLSFLLAYSLPLVSRSEKALDGTVLLATVAVITITIYQAQLIHVNPLLGLLGYHFFEVSSDTGQTHLLMTRRHSVVSGRLSAFRITEFLWYDPSSSET